MRMIEPQERIVVVETLTVSEAADRLGRCERTVRRYITDGHLSAERVALEVCRGAYRVRLDELEHFRLHVLPHLPSW